MHAFSVSVHDVAPATWNECEALLALADAVHAPVTLLVVPEYHGDPPIDADRRFVACLKSRVARGDEVVVHGFRHEDEGPGSRTPLEWLRRNVYTAGEGEFDAIDADEAARRLTLGIACLERAGLEPTGFVAPAWLMGTGCRAALRHQPLAYTSTRTALIEIVSGRQIPAPSLVYSSRSQLRRILSRVVNRTRLAGLAAAPLVRVALHPADARYPGVIREWQALLARLAAARAPILERAALELPDPASA